MSGQLSNHLSVFSWRAAIIAALSLLGILAFGGRINFWQALAVTFYSALPVVVIQKLLGLVILYLKSPDDLHPILNQETTLQDNLGILFSPADHPVLFVMASFIGLTSFYGLWLRAKGLHMRRNEGKQKRSLGCRDYVVGAGSRAGNDLYRAVPGIYLVGWCTEVLAKAQRKTVETR